MYYNQYIIVNDTIDLSGLKLNRHKFGSFSIYAHPRLNVTISGQGSVRIGLLGYIINPLFPDDTNEGIIEKLAERSLSINELFKEADLMSGRYVLIYKNDSSFIVFGDACHLRQIYYGGQDEIFSVTSSPKLFLDAFNYEPRISSEKIGFIFNPSFVKNESVWYGSGAIDDRLNKLLPNHYLDINKKVYQRRPYVTHNLTSEGQISLFARTILHNSFKALAKRYRILQPLTAGMDSRLLLAASRNFKDSISYYIFDYSSGDVPDVNIPLKLSSRLDLDFRVLNPGRLRTDFLIKYNNEHIIPRILPKTANIQYHYDCKYDTNVINLNGNCLEIVRFPFAYTKRIVSLDKLVTLSGLFHRTKIPYFRDQIDKWYYYARQYADCNEIGLIGLFYWEHNIGNWHALWQFEQDIAVEEFSPYNNRGFLNSLFRVKLKKRNPPNYPFFMDIIKGLWEDVLAEPINPGRPRIIKWLSSNYFVCNMRLKLERFLY